MGGAVSAGRDNNDLVDNLVESSYIKTDLVERVFRAVDRADYFLPGSRHSAYKDIAWKCGSFHLSAPCIYSDVMEWLKLRAGLSFLNLGSGTGYLSTMAGLILGTNGINHGVELNSTVVNYAIDRLEDFIQNSSAIDEFDFCHPKFVIGNCLCLSPSVQQYDRVYCGAACPKNFENYLKNLIKVGGILVMPLDDKLLQIKRISEREWATKSIQCVSFATLVTPTPEQGSQHVTMLDVAPASLQVLCRTLIRNVLRNVVYEENSQFRNTPLKSKKVRAKPKFEAYRVRRISIPIEDEESDTDDFSLLHNLDRETGSREMNALLNLVLSMENDVVAADLNYESDNSTIDENNGSDNEQDENFDENLPEDYPGDSKNNSTSSDDVQKRTPTSSTPGAAEQKVQQTTECSSLVSKISKTGECKIDALSKNEVTEDKNSNKLDIACSSSKPNKLEEEVDTSQSTSSNVRKPKVSIAKKREKFDSGIIEDVDEGASLVENCNSSPDTTTGSEQMDVNSSEEYLGDNEQKISDKQDCNKSRRSRRQRKRHYTDEEQDADGEEGDSSEPDVDGSPPAQAVKVKKMKRKSPPPPNPCDAQRLLLSNLLKTKVNKLPLPTPLKIFVNMNRDF